MRLKTILTNIFFLLLSISYVSAAEEIGFVHLNPISGLSINSSSVNSGEASIGDTVNLRFNSAKNIIISELKIGSFAIPYTYLCSANSCSYNGEFLVNNGKILQAPLTLIYRLNDSTQTSVISVKTIPIRFLDDPDLATGVKAIFMRAAIPGKKDYVVDGDTVFLNVYSLAKLNINSLSFAAKVFPAEEIQQTVLANGLVKTSVALKIDSKIPRGDLGFALVLNNEKNMVWDFNRSSV